MLGRNRLPILVGGTGFYLEWLMRGRPEAPVVPELIKKLTDAEIAGLSWQEALQKLQSVDPVTAAKLSANDIYRLARALSVYKATGKPLSSFSRYTNAKGPFYDWQAYYLTTDRHYLATRIDARTEVMFEAGLLEEVWGLWQEGMRPDSCSAARAIGYSQCLAFFAKLVSQGEAYTEKDGLWLKNELEQLIKEIQAKTRQYSRSQNTWFTKKSKDFTWILRSHPFSDDLSEIGEKLIESMEYCPLKYSIDLQAKEARFLAADNGDLMKTYKSAPLSLDLDGLVDRLASLLSSQK